MSTDTKAIVRRSTLSHEPLQMSELHPVLARVLAQRGVADMVELEHGLAHLPSPDLLLGIEQAASCIGQALMQQESILVVGDFDADGATSSALAVLALRAFGATSVEFLVPNRFEYGYGLTPELVEVAFNKVQPKLLITVDNGISSIAGVDKANGLGMQVVVTDHHLPGEQLPNAAAIVNPNQAGCSFPSKCLAGVGVIFYVMSAVRRYLQQHTWWRADRPAPNMAQFLDLVAVGTVADVVPLDHNNRILVQQGLSRIRAGQCRPGITALLQLANRYPRWVVSQDLGFAVGPRLNAAGRLQDMQVGIECLLASSFDIASEKAQILHDLNRERRDIEADMQHEAMDILQSLSLEEVPLGICLYQPNWHQGVIGILAGRLKEQFGRPAAVFAQTGEGQLKGSFRSVKGVHIRDVLADIATQMPDLLVSFGGHAMAAGATILERNIETFNHVFNQRLQQLLGSAVLHQELFSDGQLQGEFLNAEVAEYLRAAVPWGQGFEEPLFDGVFTIVRRKWLGDKHIKLLLTEPETGCLVDAIAFNQSQADWPSDQNQMRILYKLDINDYQNRRQLQLVVQHVEQVQET